MRHWGLKSKEGRSVSHVLFFLVDDRTFTSRVSSPPLVDTVRCTQRSPEGNNRDMEDGCCHRLGLGRVAFFTEKYQNVTNVLLFI